jgi:hypothetical protein
LLTKFSLRIALTLRQLAAVVTSSLENKMNKFLLTAAAISGLAGCDLLNQSSSSDTAEQTAQEAVEDVIEATQYATFERQENGDVVLSADGQEFTIPAARFAEYDLGTEAKYGYVSVPGGYSNFVSQSSENVDVAGGVVQTNDGGVVYTGYSGVDGDTVLAPTSGSTNYAGTWAAAHETNHNDIHVNYGDLTLTHDFNDNSVTGSGTYTGGGAEVLSVDAMADAGGDITGTVTLSIYSDAVRTGDLEAGFFGEGASEIAGAFNGDGLGGTILAERQPEVVPD